MKHPKMVGFKLKCQNFPWEKAQGPKIGGENWVWNFGKVSKKNNKGLPLTEKLEGSKEGREFNLEKV